MSSIYIYGMHRQFNTKDSPTTSPAYYLPTNTNEEVPCPSSCTEQGQISCAHFELPDFTHSSPTETTAHSCQLTAQIHSPILTLHSHIPFATQKLHSRTENSLKLTGLSGLINWTAEASWTRVKGGCDLQGSKVSTNRRMHAFHGGVHLNLCYMSQQF